MRPPSVPTREKSRLKEHPLPEQPHMEVTPSAPAPRPPEPNGKSGERRTGASPAFFPVLGEGPFCGKALRPCLCRASPERCLH